VLREGLSLYPSAVELHVGMGYARLAREEYAWARRAFEEALILDAEHEDALAGLGETLMKFGQQDAALRLFRRYHLGNIFVANESRAAAPLELRKAIRAA